jgi:serine/threonine-protein kinase
MGRVYRAVQSPLDRVVALKVLSPNFPSSRDPGFQQRFLREASLSAKLRHPNTVTLIDYGQTEDEIYYIAMEFLEGRTLAQELSRVGPLPWGRALEIGQQICRSLREAHKLSIVHRDLKPANVMLLNEADHDIVKVLDFGLVKSVLPPGQGVKSPEITQHGTFLGSPQYIAPEQARNIADARSDVYSLGVVLYQMLMGRPPFISKDYIELIFSHMKEPPPAFASLRPELAVPPEIEAMVRRCLEKDPKNRFQSMDEVLEAMREANRQAGGQSGIFRRVGSTTGPFLSAAFEPEGRQSSKEDAPETVAVDISVDVPEAKAQGRRKALIAAGAALGAALAVVVVSLFMARPAPPPPPTASAAAAKASKTAASSKKIPATKPAAPVPTPSLLGGIAAEDIPLADWTPVGSGSTRAPVHFLLTSDPSGAQVFYNGVLQGVTPFVLDIRPEGDELGVNVELTFAKAGYITEKVVTGGSGEVVLRQKLTRKPKPLPPPVATVETVGAQGPMPMPVFAFTEGMTRPERLSGRDIEYTEEAIAANVQGLMKVKCIITVMGKVENCRILETVPYMDQAVLDALTTRVYSPATYQGKPVAVEYIFNFRLRPPQQR